MSWSGSFDRFVAGVVNELDIHSATYDEICAVVRTWIEIAERNSATDNSTRETATSFDLEWLSRFYEKRHFAAFRTHFRKCSSLAEALIELFLLSRIRTYVLAYLSVQEGEDFEGASSYETQAPLLIAQLMRHLGKRPLFVINLGIGWVRLVISLDPLVHLRRMYGLLLLSRRRKPRHFQRIRIAIEKLAFVIKVNVAAFTIRSHLRLLTTDQRPKAITNLLRQAGARRLIAISVLVLIPSARELSEQEWRELFRRIEEHFVPCICTLCDAIPDHSLANHGMIKLFKVAFGTIVGRTSVRHLHEKDNLEFIWNTLRIAYSWGVTYPLVDNVLDSRLTDDSVREALTERLGLLFDQCDSDDRHCPDQVQDAGVQEVERRVAEVLSLMPQERLSRARRLLMHLLESHRRDAKRRLSTVETENFSETRMLVMVDTVLKAALIRLATMEVCGIVVDRPTVCRNLVRSLFNQLGDDLWDIYEDFDDDRVTPFTLFLVRGDGPDPFVFYLTYSMLLAGELPNRRRAAAMMGCCETLRDSLIVLKGMGNDPLRVAAAIEHALERSSGTSVKRHLPDVPHIDFDAVLFAFERALIEFST